MRHSPLIVIQSRYNSKRLYGKALYPICGLPLISFLIKRLKYNLPADYIIVLATTENKEDDILVEWANHEKINVFRGHENDVLKRYIDCLNLFSSKTIVRVTGDNPLTCPKIIEWLISKKIDNKLDYIFCENLPYGVGVDIFHSDTLIQLDKKTDLKDEREHINLHILRNLQNFKTAFPKAEDRLDRPDLRMTVDTIDDWININRLFFNDKAISYNISLIEAIKIMDIINN
ncbi:spore coat polysaccharide biosynthesis protein SpsF [Candidatus Magnetomorum sp. HK-1]|nr:spore coat polysaccharide biosynthesis protein SpsF [Candidatus Magnetomorum sp. HK-1]